jgi:hypothetical protein
VRVDLTSSMVSSRLLARELRNDLLYYSGRQCPMHYSQAEYDQALNAVGANRKLAAELLDRYEISDVEVGR